MVATAKQQVPQDKQTIAQASMEAFSNSIDRIMKEIEEKNAEIQALTNALKGAYSKLTTLGLFAPKERKTASIHKVVSGVPRFFTCFPMAAKSLSVLEGPRPALESSKANTKKWGANGMFKPSSSPFFYREFWKEEKMMKIVGFLVSSGEGFRVTGTCCHQDFLKPNCYYST
ncbi:MAG: hypothetical protein KGO96_07150 [Elusimicrobia bacterium]|nr:hypothetical protein [Elusimicrobiota bacterium]